MLHVFPDADTTQLLINTEPDNTEPATVLVMDEPTEFSADVTHQLDQAWDVVQHFPRTGDITALGQ